MLDQDGPWDSFCVPQESILTTRTFESTDVPSGGVNRKQTILR